MIPHEQSEGKTGKEDGHRQHRKAGLDELESTCGDSGSKGHEHGTEHPAEVDRRAGDVGVVGDLIEEHAVGGCEEHEAKTEQQPGAIGAPAGQREHHGNECEQRHVRDRICEIRDHRNGLAGRHVEDARQHNRGSQRGHRQRTDHPVEEQARTEPVPARTQKEEQPQIHRRVEREPQRIGGRREGRALHLQDHVAPVHVARPPEDDAASDQEPRQALTMDGERDAHQSGRHDRPVVDHEPRTWWQSHLQIEDVPRRQNDGARSQDQEGNASQPQPESAQISRGVESHTY